MQTSVLDRSQISKTVIAVPPLCRDELGIISSEQNNKLFSHIYDGGVRAFLYGGNANLYHIRPSEYEGLLEILCEAPDDAIMIPSVGPAFGLAMDQAQMLSKYSFPTTMLLPQTAVKTQAGLMSGFRHLVEALDQL